MYCVCVCVCQFQINLYKLVDNGSFTTAAVVVYDTFNVCINVLKYGVCCGSGDVRLNAEYDEVGGPGV